MSCTQGGWYFLGDGVRFLQRGGARGRMAQVKAAETRVLIAEPEFDRYLSHALR
jgi:hypothetical protein